MVFIQIPQPTKLTNKRDIVNYTTKNRDINLWSFLKCRKRLIKLYKRKNTRYLEIICHRHPEYKRLVVRKNLVLKKPSLNHVNPIYLALIKEDTRLNGHQILLKLNIKNRCLFKIKKYQMDIYYNKMTLMNWKKLSWVKGLKSQRIMYKMKINP